MRILLAMAGAGPTTTAELSAQLDDVPPATLYRHLNALHKGGVIEVAEERRVRGATERRFTLPAGRANLGPADFAAATPDEQLRWFATFLAGILDTYGRYVRAGAGDPVRDGVGFREVVLQLSDQELADMGAAINAAVVPFLANAPADDRAPRLLATILVPVRPLPAPDASHSAAPEGDR
jgi:predicted ArsR family transcriptional regulator